MTDIVEKLVLEFQNGIVKGGKAFLLIGRFDITSGFENCGNEKKFVDIDNTIG